MLRSKSFIAVMLLALLCAPAEAAAPPRKPAAKAPVTKAAPKPAARPASQTAAPTSEAAIPLLKMGLAEFNEGKLTQAEQHFKQATGKMAPNDPNFLVAYDVLAKIYYRQDKYQEALPYAQKAQGLIAKRYGAQSIETANAVYLVANIQQNLNNAPAAEAGYKNAIVLYELPANAANYAATYPDALQNLGTMASRNKNSEAALALYKKALSVKQNHQDADTGSILENIGICYQNAGDLDNAARYYQQALAQYQNEGEKGAVGIQRVQFKLANIRPSAVAAVQGAQTSNYDGRFYEAAKKAFNTDRNYPEAASQFKLALEQVNKYQPREERFIASLRVNIGKSLYYGEGEEDAAPYLEQGLAYLGKSLPANDEQVLDLHAMLGLVNKKKNDFESAEKHFQYVVTHADKNSESYVSVLPALADNLSHQGRFQEAKPVYEEALALYQKQQVPADDSRIKSVQYQLALLDKMFRSQEQDKAQYFNYAVEGIHRWNEENGTISILLNGGQAYKGWDDKYLGLVQKAFQEWQTALDNRIRFQFTTDPEKTDVVFNWTDKPISETDIDAKVGIHKYKSVRGFFLQSDIIVSLAESGKKRTDEEIYSTALHEIGHLLGLSHSSNLSDIMAEIGNYSHPANSWPALTARDLQAVRYLYQQKPAITNPKGITLAEFRKFNVIADEGVEAFKRSNYKQAFRIFENARSVFAEDPYINFYCGVSAFENGDYHDARGIFETLVMPESAKVFSVDSQLGMIYVELGHKYNKFGKKNKAAAKEFYAKGVRHLQTALQNPAITPNQRDYLAAKLREGLKQRRPEPVYYYDIVAPIGRFY